MIASLFVAASVVFSPAAASTPPGSPSIARPAEALSQPVKLQTADKQDLSGRYFAPAKKRSKSKGLAPGALLIHDAGASSHPLDELAAYLQKKGFGVLVLDLRGHGDSTGDQMDWSTADEKARRAMWAFAIKDVAAGAAFLSKQDGVHSSNLTLIGAGSGAALAVRYAIDDDATRAVVLIDPAKDAQGFDVSKGVGELGGLPTFILIPKASKKVATAIQASAHKANDDYEFVEVSYLGSKADKVLEDSKLGSLTYGWLKGQVRE